MHTYFFYIIHLIVFPPSNFRITSAKTQISAGKRLTIYFHAVLSKHFKLDPSEDRIFIRAGAHIGTWDDVGTELFVTK